MWCLIVTARLTERLSCSPEDVALGALLRAYTEVPHQSVSRCHHCCPIVDNDWIDHRHPTGRWRGKSIDHGVWLVHFPRSPNHQHPGNAGESTCWTAAPRCRGGTGGRPRRLLQARRQNTDGRRFQIFRRRTRISRIQVRQLSDARH